VSNLRIVKCLRCDHEWATRLEHPTRCANQKCKSPYWDKPKKSPSKQGDVAVQSKEGA
jgi:hypothetical protein